MATTKEQVIQAKTASVVDRLLRPSPDHIKSQDPALHWLAKNFVGVGVGWRVKGGNVAKGEWALRIYVRRKLRPETDKAILGDFLVEKWLNGLIDVDFPTDVIETGRFCHAAGPPPWQRTSLCIGGDVQLAGSSTHGTICAFVKVENESARRLLSCSHVLDGHGNLGQGVLSQGVLVGHLSEQVLLQPDGISSPGQQDCACAELAPGVEPLYELPQGLGRLSSSKPADAQLGMPVKKAGRSVGDGKVADLQADIRVDFDGLTTVLHNQILVQGYGSPFAEPGDSGSLVIAQPNGQRLAVGMISAAGSGPATATVNSGAQGNWTAVCPMQDVLYQLKATLLV